MKALKATLTTSQPVISPDDFSTVFYRIPDLYSAHKDFLEGLKEQTGQPNHSPAAIGDLFQALVSKNSRNKVNKLTKYSPSHKHANNVTITLLVKTRRF